MNDLQICSLLIIIGFFWFALHFWIGSRIGDKYHIFAPPIIIFNSIILPLIIYLIVSLVIN